ncbi:fumarylacetoacetate hydrolase family protein [Microbacterium sp. NPDC077663]|uniref:fumarylacetoacetate hydrolase family protein n=1 Tax=Microbacterium sp. NPDC077663 TaxID=3364189 RepID=UPI0037C8AFE0
MYFSHRGPRGHELPVVTQDGETFDLTPLTPRIDGAFLAADGVARTRKALADGILPRIDLPEDARTGAPIAAPGKIVCIGLNYRDHADETNAPYPAEPVVFMKAADTLSGPHDDVPIPRGSTKTDWEVELAVVIGREARYLDTDAEAAAVIAGYALSHDVSEREFQLERGGQWDKGKNCEGFNPLGPWFVPADEIEDVQNLSLRLWVNGELKQDGSTANQIFPVLHVVRYLSQFMVLRPGDVINTGTPAGVALGANDFAYLRDGDVVELEIAGLGRARQRFVNA